MAQKRRRGYTVVGISHSSQCDLAIGLSEQGGADDRLAGQENKAPLVLPETIYGLPPYRHGLPETVASAKPR